MRQVQAAFDQDRRPECADEAAESDRDQAKLLDARELAADFEFFVQRVFADDGRRARGVAREPGRVYKRGRDGHGRLEVQL